MKLPSIIILFFVIAGIYSCKKGYDIPETVGLPSYLNTINSTQDTLNYFLNGTRQNNTSTIFPLGSTNYLNVTSGQNNYEFRKNGSPVVLFGKVLSLKDTTYQTLFVCGETADKAFISQDTLKPSLTGAKIRFVNTAAGSGPLTATLNDTAIARSFPFQKLGSYYNTSAGTKTLKIYVSGSTTPGVTQTFALTTGVSYTMYVKGLPTGTGQAALRIGLFGR